LLALKLKAARITDRLRGEAERLDILNPMRVLGISTADEAIAVWPVFSRERGEC